MRLFKPGETGVTLPLLSLLYYSLKEDGVEPKLDVNRMCPSVTS